jgi:hypothetical protein
MKQCAYCGRENEDDAVCCRECGTSEFKNVKTLPTEESTVGESEMSPSTFSGEVRSVASLDTSAANKLLQRLNQKSIPAEFRTVTEESGVEVTQIMVESSNYERGCDVADEWLAEQEAESAKRSGTCCPKCRSPHVDYVSHDKLEFVFRCQNCGCEFLPNPRRS